MRLAATLATLFLLTLPLSADDWIFLRSEHFQLFGNASERELRDVALRLEQFREAILKLNPASVRDSAPVIALIFRDDRSFRPFMSRANGRVVPVTGVFTGGPDGSYIGLSLDSAEQAYRGIFHEYSHYLLRNAFPVAPVWFNEGLAEYYSTFEVINGGRSARIGLPHEPHIALLRDRRLPLTQLFGITRTSDEYTRDVPDRIRLYAQSWLLVHHALHGEPRRHDQLIALARRMAAGGDLATSLRDTYGMGVTDLERDLQAYVRRPIFQATNVDFTENIVTRLDTRAAPADEAELDARLGGLAAALGNIEEASRRLERALKAKPDAGHVHLSLSSLRARQGRREEASAHMRRARELGALPSAAATHTVRLTESDARAALPELFAKLDTVRPPASEKPPPPDIVRSLPEPRVRLLLTALKPGEQVSLGTIEAIDCRAAGIVVVLRTAEGGTVRASAASFGAVNFVTFREATPGTIACGKQPPAPARLIWRQEGAAPVALTLELLPEGYEP